MNELSGQPANPVQPVDHTHVPGQGPDKRPDQDQGTKAPPDRPGGAPADQARSTQPDQKHAPSDTSHAPDQAGPSAGHPDVQNYLNLEKQGPNTMVQPARGGADAIPLQTVPPTSAADHAAPAPNGPHAETTHPADTKHPAETQHPADTKHSTEPQHAADVKHPAETQHSADSQRGPAPGAANAPGAGPGAHDRAADTRAANEAHETPADRELRLHLQPFGVTPEQARDYMRIALVPQLQLNPLTKMTIDEIQRASNAVSHLPPQHLDHLTAQAKAAGPADRPTRQTLDLSHLPAVARFKMDPAPPVRFAQLPQLHIDPGDEKHRDPFKQPAPKPADQQSDLAKKTADYAAQGHPSHRVPDMPDSERAKAGGVDDLIDAVEEALGLPKISGSFERTAPSGPADPGENKGTFTVGGSF